MEDTIELNFGPPIEKLENQAKEVVDKMKKKASEKTELEVGKIPDANEKKGKFRLQLRKGKLLLTYKSHIDRVLYGDFIHGKGKKCEIYIAHETADAQNPYLHSHVLIIYSVKIDTTDPRYFDFQEIHPNIKKILTKKHFINSLKYMMKEDKTHEDELINLAEENELTLFDRISECKTIQDALRMADVPGDATGIVTMYNYRIMPGLKVLPPKFPWQTELDHEIQTEPDDRSIIWYMDPPGNSGKTKMAKFCAVTYPEDVYIVNQFGGPANAASIIKSALNGGWSGKTLIVNLSRTAEEKAIYEPLEMIKDGFITTTKWAGQTLLFQEPHVVVFANFEPDIHKMSLDRWKIRILGRDDKNIPVVTDRYTGYGWKKLIENESCHEWHDGSGTEFDEIDDDMGGIFDKQIENLGVPAVGRPMAAGKRKY